MCFVVGALFLGSLFQVCLGSAHERLGHVMSVFSCSNWAYFVEICRLLATFFLTCCLNICNSVRFALMKYVSIACFFQHVSYQFASFFWRQVIEAVQVDLHAIKFFRLAGEGHILKGRHSRRSQFLTYYRDFCQFCHSSSDNNSHVHLNAH